MERKDVRDPYRERAETWRGTDPQNQYYRGQDRTDRPHYSETTSRSYENRDPWDGENTQAMTESGRQYEPSGGHGYGRQGYTAGQSGQGYYGTRPANEGAGVGYAGGQYARGGEDYGYGRQGYTAGQSGQGYYGTRPSNEPSGVGYAGGQYARGGEDYGYGRQGSYGAQRTRESSGAGYFGDESRRGWAGQYTGQYAGLGPKNYVRSDDRILEDVCRALTEDPAVDAGNIEVLVISREVTLNGTVPSREQRRRAEDCAEQVPGVAHVQNNVRVARNEGWGSTSDRRYDIARDETDSLISSDKVEGTAVYGADRQKIGSIESVMLTKRGGKVAYAVLSFGGFLGLGTEHYPLPWNILKYHTDLGGYIVNLTKDQLEAAPKYGANDSWDWTDPATSRRIDMYYNPWMGALL